MLPLISKKQEDGLGKIGNLKIISMIKKLWKNF